MQAFDGVLGLYVKPWNRSRSTNATMSFYIEEIGNLTGLSQALLTLFIQSNEACVMYTRPDIN